MASAANVNLTTVKRGDTYVVNFFFTDTNGSKDISHVAIAAHAKRAIDGEIWFDLNPVKVNEAEGHFRIHLTREQTRQITESPPGSFSGIYDIQFSWPGADEVFVATIVEGSISISKDITIVNEDLQPGGDGSITAGSLDIELSGSLNPGDFAYDDKMTVEQITQNRYAIGGAVGLGEFDWAVQAAISAAYAKQYKDETKAFRDETEEFRNQANQHRAIALQAAAASQASAETAAEIAGLDNVDEAVRRLADLRESLLKKATLRMHFDKNEYFVYEDPFGMQPKEITQVLTTERTTAGTYQSPFGLRVARPNLPRINFADGLLCEESRTNLLSNSNLFDGSSQMGAQNTCTATATTDLKLYENEPVWLVEGASSSGFVESNLRVDLTSFPVNTPLTYSIWVYPTQGITQITLRSNSNAQGFNDLRQNITVIPNMWQRIWFNCARAEPFMMITISNVIDGGLPFYASAAQLEEGSHPTSYIKTEGSQVVRSRDGCLLKSELNPVEGAFFVDAVSSGNTGHGAVFGVGSGNSEELRVGYSSFDRDSFGLIFRSSGVDKHIITPLEKGERAKCAVSYSQTASGEFLFKFFFNSLLIGQDTLPALPSRFLSNGVSLGSRRPNSNSLHWNSTISQFSYIPRYLSDLELTELTK